MIKAEHHILVCTSSRINGTQKGCCHSKESVNIVGRFMEELEERDLRDTVLLSNTGCLGICEKGPIVVVYPEGIWYGEVTADDVEEIMDSHIENGKPVERLLLK